LEHQGVNVLEIQDVGSDALLLKSSYTLEEIGEYFEKSYSMISRIVKEIDVLWRDLTTFFFLKS